MDDAVPSVMAPKERRARGAGSTDLRSSARLLANDTLSAHERAAWQRLGTQSAGNVFAQPWVVAAGLQHCAAQAVHLAFVNGAAGELIGVIPLVRATRLGRFPLPHWRVWSHPNSFCAPILIRPGHERDCWQALVRHLAVAPESSGAAALVIADHPFADLSNLGHPRLVLARSQRAAISAGEPLLDYWDTHVRAKKRKELRRQAARLAELGALDVTELGPGEDSGPWVDEFLSLEARGWKGAAGSALAAAPGTAAYFRSVVAGAHQGGALLFLALRLDRRPIAMLVTLIDGDAAFSFKTAYDEDYARFSPGVLLQRDNLAALAKRRIVWADSCAAADHPMIDSIWTQRRAMATVAVALPGLKNRLTFAAYKTALAGWRRVKPLLDRSA